VRVGALLLELAVFLLDPQRRLLLEARNGRRRLDDLVLRVSLGEDAQLGLLGLPATFFFRFETV
jgi:hypothetical protein